MLDCKLLDNVFKDLLRYKIMAKVKEDQFIFVRRSANTKSQKKQIAKGKGRKNANVSRINEQAGSIAHADIELDFAQ